MKLKKLTLLITTLILSTSCIKTAEQIEKEKRFERRQNQSSKLIAELTSRVQVLQNSQSSTSGQLEEMNHKQSETNEEKEKTYQMDMNQLNEQTALLLKQTQKQKNQIAVLQNHVKAHQKFIKSLTKTLGSGKSKKSNSILNQAHKQFEKGKYNKATTLYLEALSTKINARQKNHAKYNLGFMAYRQKKYNDAISYFSKIYTKYPKSSWAPKCLLYIGRSLAKSGNPEGANATFTELISKHPKSSHAKKAKKEIK